MLDIKYIRENVDLVKKVTSEKRVDPTLIDRVLVLDEKRRGLIQKIEELRSQRNEAAKDKDIEKGKKIKIELQAIEPELPKVEEDYKTLLWQIPNTIADDVPVGKDESENVVLRTWGKPREFDFVPKDYVDLGESLGIIDTKKAATVAGARFGYFFGAAVLLEYALLQFAYSVLLNEETLKEIADSVEPGYSPKPFIPVIPPVMVKPDVFEKMARLNPKEERYYIPSDDVYLIGSAEHTLGPIHMDETLDVKKLPLRYVGFTPAFRREAGSYGKDTRGVLRVHQFDKIEMESFTSGEDGIKEQNFFVAIQEYLMQKLELPYQVVGICTGDMGGPDYRQIDIEAWFPAQGKYRETHTSDYMTDYQARRLNTKYRKGAETSYIHMNDATAFSQRPILAIIENYQNEDGSVAVPKVLQPWVGTDVIVKPL